VSYESTGFRGGSTYTDEPGYRQSGFRESQAYLDDRVDDAGSDGSYGARGNGTSYDTGTFAVDSYGAEQGYGTEPAVERDEIPEELEPPRDRLAIQFGWEALLVAAVGGVGFLLHRADAGAFKGGELTQFYLVAAVFGLVAVGMALTVRAGVPNLAVGSLAFGGAMFFAENSERGLLPTAAVTALLAVGAGLVIAVVVVVLHVPSWAASLAVALAVIAWMQSQGTAKVVAGAYQPDGHAVVWFAAFAVLSVAGGAVCLIPGMRRTIGRFRPEGDPAVRGSGSMSAGLALVGSSALAAVAGVLLALSNREIHPSENGIGLTALALGAALLGGVSIYGRRGGLFGTFLAVVGISLVMRYATAEAWKVDTVAFAAGAIMIGLVASRLVETFGRRPQREAISAGTSSPATRDDRWSTR
jgi:ribose/xylose/arabinose/galactoside ABC-type transport system permease subunit